MKLLKKLHGMRATVDFKVFRFKVLRFACSEPERKHGGKYSFIVRALGRGGSGTQVGQLLIDINV